MAAALHKMANIALNKCQMFRQAATAFSAEDAVDK